MKKLLLSAAALLLMGMVSQAAPVDANKAQRVALNFWNSHRPQSERMVEQMQLRHYDELPNMHVFVPGERGFVIVAADDCVQPILGYSFENPFPTELHPEVRYWLRGYDAQVEEAAQVGGQPHAGWAQLLEQPVPVAPTGLGFISSLCETQWGQSDPYNQLCPWDSSYNERAVVGCVATAMAQIMKRWNHPSCGVGQHSYEHQAYFTDTSYGVLSADFEHTTYLWEDMPNVAVYAVDNHTAMVLSTLCYHIGVSVDMMYGPSSLGGSAAYSSCGYWSTSCAESALRDYFKYSPDLKFLNRYEYSDSEWVAMIDSNLVLGQPMYYSGSDYSGGHAFVLDGVNKDTMYHFNWGWNGVADGYYPMSDLSPRTGGVGGNATYTFNQGQGGIFGIAPVPEVFDTVEMYDTICALQGNYVFYEYELSKPKTQLYSLRHLDSIINLHLFVQPSHNVVINPGYGNSLSGFEQMEYCVREGLVMPECTFERKKKHFTGWGFSKNADEIYQPGDTVFTTGNVTIYAQWIDSSKLGIVELDDENLNVWPNPAKDELYVSLGSHTDGGVQVALFDAVGRQVLSISTIHENGKIDLSKLAEGIYLMRVVTEDGIYNRRIIKQ